jgi:hypothetical protein
MEVNDVCQPTNRGFVYRISSVDITSQPRYIPGHLPLRWMSDCRLPAAQHLPVTYSGCNNGKNKSNNVGKAWLTCANARICCPHRGAYSEIQLRKSRQRLPGVTPRPSHSFEASRQALWVPRSSHVESGSQIESLRASSSSAISTCFEVEQNDGQDCHSRLT